jgi:hypothetical protein
VDINKTSQCYIEAEPLAQRNARRSFVIEYEDAAHNWPSRCWLRFDDRLMRVSNVHKAGDSSCRICFSRVLRCVAYPYNFLRRKSACEISLTVTRIRPASSNGNYCSPSPPVRGTYPHCNEYQRSTRQRYVTGLVCVFPKAVNSILPHLNHLRLRHIQVLRRYDWLARRSRCRICRNAEGG